MDLFYLLLAQKLSGGGGGGGAAKQIKNTQLTSENKLIVTYVDDTGIEIDVPTDFGEQVPYILVDGKKVGLQYDDQGNLIKIGKIVVEGMDNYPSNKTLMITVPALEDGGICSVDKTYQEIMQNIADGNPTFIQLTSLNNIPFVPSRLLSDGSIKFIAEIHEDIDDSDFILSITVHSDNTANWANEGIVTKLLARTVTFKADDQPYSIVSVTPGQSVSAPDPNPISESGTFAGWLDGESTVTFPFTPEADTVLNAEFLTVRSEMEWNESGDWAKITNPNGTFIIKKKNPSKTIMAYSQSNTANSYICVMIGISQSDIETIDGSGTLDNIVYDGTTYYYRTLSPGFSKIAEVYNSVLLDGVFSDSDKEQLAVKTLDHYFLKD